MNGWTFGNGGYKDKTPLDFISDPVTGIRPGSYAKKEPTGVSNVDLSEGIRNYHIIPPFAVWEKGKWFDQLSLDTQASLSIVKPEDERQTWVVAGEGTPGDFLIRTYKVPEKISEFQDAKHPANWTKLQKEKGDSKNLYDPISGYGGWGYGTQQTKPKPVSPPKPPPLPSGITFRCVGCGHWFESDTRLASHATHCCPGSDNWGEDGADWVIACKCCLDYDQTAECKPGFPRKPKEAPKEKEVEAEPVPSGA